MIKKIEIDYKKYLDWKLDFQKKLGKINFPNLIIISWVTCVGKSTLIEKNKLPSLVSYKTWNNITAKKKQIIINAEKFHKKMLNWEFFDIYSVNWNYYWYSIEDYHIIQKEYGNVFLDISIESIYLWLKYNTKEILILDYSEKQINRNVKKRIQEREYSKKRINILEKTIKKEKKFLEKIKERNKFIYLKTPFESKKQINFINSSKKWIL